MLRSRVALTAVVVVLAGLAGPFADASTSSSANFLVPTSKASTGFGPFKEFNGQRPDAAELRRVFGHTSSEWRNGAQTCVLRWFSLGIRVDTFTSGSQFRPCLKGSFSGARLTDKRWHTESGIHPGSSKSDAHAKSLRTCTTSTCGVNGYALELFGSDCSGGVQFPVVIAETRGNRVVALRVHTHGCE